MMAKKDEIFSQASYYLLQELFKSEKHFEKLVKNMHEIIFMCDDEGHMNFLNQSWERLLGYSIAESLGRSIDDYICKEERGVIFKLISEEAKHRALRFCHRNGDTVWLELSVCKTYTRKNLGVLYNINARKLIENKIETERQKLFAILDVLPASILLRTEDCHITYCNQYFKENFGDGVGKLCYEVMLCDENLQKECPSSYVFKNKAHKIWEWVNPRNNHTYQIYDYPFNDIDGTPLLLKLGIDITDRKKTEKQKEKLIGDLEKVLAKVKTLNGFIPICASCKNIRDDEGYWSQIEDYIRKHSEAEFTHTICPKCQKALYPGLE